MSSPGCAASSSANNTSLVFHVCWHQSAGTHHQGTPYQVTVHTRHAQVWVGIHMPHAVESGLKGAVKRWRDAQTALLPGAELPSLIDAT